MVTHDRGAAGASYTDEATYRDTRLPVDLATTLVPDAYTSQAFFDIERERVFAAGWVAVGTVDQIADPGRLVVAEVAGRSVIVTRNKQGALRGFHNVCRHRGTRLVDGGSTPSRTRHIRCPYHSWTYDLDGRCVGTPLFEGSDIPRDQRGIFDMSTVRGFDKADYGLFPVRVDTWGFLVFVNLDMDAAPLTDWLGDLPERMAGYRLSQWRVLRRRRYDVAANYKLIGENFMEYYHLPWVHPELIRVSRVENHHRWQGRGMYTGMCTSPVSGNTDAGGWHGLPVVPGLSDADADAGRFVWLFPSTALVVLPNHAFVVFTRPRGPDRSVEEALILTHRDSVGRVEDGDLDQLEGFWDLVNRQDLDIIERVQQGLTDPAYTGGRMCYRFEEPVHRFQNMIIDRMVGVDRVPGGDDESMTPMFPTGQAT